MIKFESEKHLEDFIYNYYKETGKCLIDDQEYGFCSRQFRAGPYGVCDLVFFDYSEADEASPSMCSVFVVELKNEPVKPSDVAQICRYKTFFDRASAIDDVTCCLVVPDSTIHKVEDVAYLCNALESVIDFYEFSLDAHKGISFEYQNGFRKTNDAYDYNSLITNLIGG